jgi:hypothetical protein
MKYLLSALTALLLVSCNDNKKTAAASEELKDASINITQKLLGSFVGEFGDNKITLLITRAQNDTVEGRSIVGGNDRPFFGTFKETDGVYSLFAKEPGDDPNDGVFEFVIKSTEPNVVTGRWAPYDSSKAAKQYTLERRSFAYRIDVGEFPEASQRELVGEYVAEFSRSDLEYMRNEIFARHGYCFRKKHLREIFEGEEWYIPDNVDIRDKLTPIEKKNLALIKRYEKYAEEHGDEYGR